MSIYIREMTEADSEKAKDFFRHLTPDASFYYNMYHANEAGVLEQLKKPDPTRIDFATMEEQADGSELMVGHTFLWDMNTRVPWLGICLREGCEGKHLGRMLLQHLEDYCISHGCGGMMLTTHTANIRAQKLYRNFGFVYLGIHTSGEFLFYKPFPQSNGTR